ncbi:hypothetical protein BGZ97_006219 [Linnemannia gamsii]|uniref:Uncharacterized protein n=1 Tax=Linnemannia gamsii TaxID=64522 RepID=A0A9P6QRV5_9FUNG|nr:hypothetical protein BGZ97_006219 [Linnemannia gamsii]
MMKRLGWDSDRIPTVLGNDETGGSDDPSKDQDHDDGLDEDMCSKFTIGLYSTTMGALTESDPHQYGHRALQGYVN